jgi:YVTN family beta-propeller protein
MICRRSRRRPVRFAIGDAAILGVLSVASPLPAAAQPFAYVANDTSHNVSVIDTVSNTVISTVEVGSANNPSSVVTAPDGRFVYVANNPMTADEGTVSVIDAATNTVSATIATGGGPYGIAVTPNGSTLYVTNFYGTPTNNVWVIDTATNVVTHSVTVGSYPHGIAITPNGALAYVVNAFSNSVSVIQTATNVVTATISVGSMPHGVAISPDGALAYISNYAAGTISVIDVATNTVAATIPLSTDAIEGMAFSSDGSLAYACHQHSNIVSIIDTGTSSVVGTIAVGTNPFGLALAPGGQRLYVANQGSQNVSVINTETHAVDATIPTAVGSYPANVALTPVNPFDVCALYDATKAAKSGSTIPIKFQLCNSSGANLSSPSIAVLATGVTYVSNQISGPVADAGHANPDNNFRYDSALGGTGGYIFNLNTNGLATGTYLLKFSISGSVFSYSTGFQVK